MRRLVLALVFAAAVVVAVARPASPPATGWLTYGNDTARSGTTASTVSPKLRIRWSRSLPGRITSQVLAVRNSGRTTVYAATSAGWVYALSGDRGRVLWRTQVGKLSHGCPQLDGYGVTGTPVIDPVRRTLYAADALGRLHALDLSTGRARAGWPVRAVDAYRDELVWGALTLVRGSVYVPTGAYCDLPMIGKLIRVETGTRRVSRWIVVPPSNGGGGGIWGWGGVAYSASRGSLFAVTGNAFEGGTNTGDDFREWALYGEHLVELSRALKLRAANHPKDVTKIADLDFVGSPVVVTRRGCAELVVALNKNGRLYAWRTSRISSGPVWTLRIAPDDPAHALTSQAAYSKPLGSLYVTTRTRLVKVEVTPKCGGRIAWSRGLGTVISTPTIAAGTVWAVAWGSRKAMLQGFDGRTGAVRTRVVVGRHVHLVGPAVLDGRLYIGSFNGLVRGLW